ncbi:regulator of polyketide synthase expression [hydrocarbon metagenome]|uniref:Regulator of polyketide synthase expression n=1 Tax=hydrocarbon metagenome TaxID=938273 RepID=A0A0W8E508_9ZZZZ
MALARIAAKSVYQLVDGVLDEGLGFAASYLEKMINRSIIITDCNGHIHYPELTGNPEEITDLFINLPTHVNQKEPYYHEWEKSLYYPVPYNGASAFIIVRNLPLKMLALTIPILDEVKLAVKCYFSKITTCKNTFEKELGEYLLYKNNADIKDIVKLSGEKLDLDHPYLVCIVEAETMGPVDWQLVTSYTREYLKRVTIDVISIASTDHLLLVIPGTFNKHNLEAESEALNPVNSNDLKIFLDQKFNISTCHGTGQIYPLLELRKSYTEARTALTLPRLLGQKGTVQKYSDLGIFSILFSQDAASLKNYSFNTLGRLLEYDEKTEGKLLPTLRELLDNCYNFKETADKLFVHINTLYYRINKIEEILELDLSQMLTRVNLYTAIKVWDTLELNGFLN